MKLTPAMMNRVLRQAVQRAQECGAAVSACHEAGYEPSRSQSNEPHVSGSRERRDAPPSGKLDARSAFRYGVRELSRSNELLARARGARPHPMDVAVAADAITPSLAQAHGVVTRAAYGFGRESARLNEDGVVKRDTVRAVQHLDRAVRSLSPFRPETGTRKRTHAPGRRRRDLERTAQ